MRALRTIIAVITPVDTSENDNFLSAREMRCLKLQTLS